MAHPVTNWLSEHSADILQLPPGVLWFAGIVLLVRLGTRIAFARLFRRLRQPGLPDWPAISQRGNCHAIHLTRVLTGWGYFLVERLSRLGWWLSRYGLLALLVSLIPHPVVQSWFPPFSRPVLAAIIVAAWLVDRTYLHHVLGRWTLGRTTEVLITPDRLITLGWMLGLVPVVRVRHREPHLGLSVLIEPHELAAAETKTSTGRPVFADTWKLTLRAGSELIPLPCVQGRVHADRIVNAFTALRELLDLQRGLPKRSIVQSALAFGRTQPRAE